LEKLKYKGETIPRSTKNCGACAAVFMAAIGLTEYDKNFIAEALEKWYLGVHYARVELIDVDPQSQIYFAEGVLLIRLQAKCEAERR